MDGVSWSECKMLDDDTEYVRRDLVLELKPPERSIHELIVDAVEAAQDGLACMTEDDERRLREFARWLNEQSP